MGCELCGGDESQHCVNCYDVKGARKDEYIKDHDKWMVIYFNYDEQCDKYEVDKVTGPYTFKEAYKIKGSYNGEGYVTLGKMETR